MDMPLEPSRRVSVLIFYSYLLTAQPGAAQEIEPRAYSASPVGVAFAAASLVRSSESFVTDPALPLADVEVTRRIATLGLGYTFGLFSDLALLTALVPYGWGDLTPRAQGTSRPVALSGLVDARVKFTTHLRGNPAMGAQAFAKAPRRTILGASLTVAAPTGQYDRMRLINIGSNRWAFKPEAGVSVPKGKWDLDASGGVWLFTKNAQFFPGGLTRTRDALLTLQGRASYTFRPRLWVAVAGAWYAGGEARIEGRQPALRMNSVPAGLALSVPVMGQQSIKVAYNAGTFVRAGPNFRTVVVTWQAYWLTRQ